MQPWINALKELTGLVSGSQHEPMVLWILVAVAACVMLAMMAFMGMAVGSTRTGLFPLLGSLTLGVLLTLLPALACRMYICPEGALAGHNLTMCAAAAGAGFIVLAVPVHAMIQHVRYLGALVSLLVAAAVAGGAVWGLGATVNSLIRGMPPKQDYYQPMRTGEPPSAPPAAEPEPDPGLLPFAE